MASIFELAKDCRRRARVRRGQESSERHGDA